MAQHQLLLIFYNFVSIKFSWLYFFHMCLSGMASIYFPRKVQLGYIKKTMLYSIVLMLQL